MSDQTPAPTGAPQVEEQPEDPFAGFQSEAYDDGERVEDAPPVETPPVEAPAGEEAVGEEETPPEPAESVASKKPQTAQERINELTRARREAEREAADLRRRLETLERRVPEEKPAEKATEEAPKGPPKPEDYEFGELDAKYISDTVDYHTERRLEEFTQRQVQAQRQAAAQAKFQATVERGTTKYADFEEKVVQGAQNGDWALSETLGVLLVESEVGEDIAYHLASHPDEAAQVYSQAPVEQARYFGRLEAKFSAARAAAAGGNEPAVTPATTRAPKAPPPVQPARGAGGTFTATASSDDFAAFERAMNKAN